MKRIDVDKEIIEEIDTEQHEKKKKKIVILILKILIPLVIVILLSYITLRYVGNYGIIVRERAIYSNKINDDLNGLKIVEFNSLLYSEDLDRKEIDKLIDKINYTNPDIIIFTGNLIKQKGLTSEEKEYLISKFNMLESSIGKYAIKGDLDNKYFEEVITSSGFTIIDVDNKETINIKKSYINIYNMNTSTNNEMIDDEIFNIILTYKPDNIDSILTNYSPEIIFSGYTLNGQIRLPLIGGLLRNSKYMDEYYKKGNTEILISGGIGNRSINARLFNHPSINFIRIRKRT